MTGTGEESLVVLSLGISLESSLEYQNIGAVLGSLFVYLTGMILDMSLGNTLGYLLESIFHMNWSGPFLFA